jgi:hypothetical protein
VIEVTGTGFPNNHSDMRRALSTFRIYLGLNECYMPTELDAETPDTRFINTGTLLCDSTYLVPYVGETDVVFRINFNGQTASSTAITIDDTMPSLLSISPTTMSPTLKRDFFAFVNKPITVADVETNYKVYLILKGKLKVKNEDREYMKNEDGTFVMKVNHIKCLCRKIETITVDANYKLTCRYPAAPTYIYDVVLMHVDNGLYLRASNIQLNTGAVITTVLPKIMSQYGGGIVTITGRNFGLLKTDNQIKIAEEFKTGIYEVDYPKSTTKDDGTAVTVENASDGAPDHYAEEIKIKLPVREYDSVVDKEYEILVMLNAVEYATCEENDSAKTVQCGIMFDQTPPAVTTVTHEYLPETSVLTS